MSVVRMVSHDRSRSRTFGCRCPVMDRNARVSTGREIVFSRFRKATDIRCGKHVVRNIRRIAESPGGSGERTVCGFSVPEQGRCRVLCSDSSRQECMKKEVSGTCRTLLHVSGCPSCSGLREMRRHSRGVGPFLFLFRFSSGFSPPDTIRSSGRADVHDAGRRGDDPTRIAEAYGPDECRKEKNFSSFDFRAIPIGQRAGRRTIRIEPDSLSRFAKEEGGADVAVSFVCDTGKRGMETQKRVSAFGGHPLLCRSSTEKITSFRPYRPCPAASLPELRVLSY